MKNVQRRTKIETWYPEFPRRGLERIMKPASVMRTQTMLLKRFSDTNRSCQKFWPSSHRLKLGSSVHSDPPQRSQSAHRAHYWPLTHFTAWHTQTVCSRRPENTSTQERRLSSSLRRVQTRTHAGPLSSLISQSWSHIYTPSTSCGGSDLGET